MGRRACDNRNYPGIRENECGHKVLPVCFLCNKVPEEGIRGGFFLRGIFICSKCEEELINSRPEKREEYMLTIAKLRNILFKDNKPW